MSGAGDHSLASQEPNDPAAPTATIEIGSGCAVTLTLDPDGFFGRDLCVCGHDDDLHPLARGVRGCVRCPCARYRRKNAPELSPGAPPPRPMPKAPPPAFARRPAVCPACNGTGREPRAADAYDVGPFGAPCAACAGGRKR